MTAVTVYLAGPMTGIADYNRPEFARVATILRHAGYDVLNPAETVLGDNATWADYMRCALAQLLQAQQIHLLPGWRQSRGATIEQRLAADLAMPAYEVQFRGTPADPGRFLHLERVT